MTAFDDVIEAIDLVNARDPRMSTGAEAAPIPQELIYGVRMSRMCESFAPEADELVQIAARGQHIERWIIPRDEYPRDRPGYLRWRNELKRHHAKRVSAIMAANGYDHEAQTVVADILMKKKLKSDPRAQLVEDLACLVFLQFYASDFASRHSPEKVVDIIAKTLPKMSDKAHAFATNLSLETSLVAAIEAAKVVMAQKDTEPDA